MKSNPLPSSLDRLRQSIKDKGIYTPQIQDTVSRLELEVEKYQYVQAGQSKEEYADWVKQMNQYRTNIKHMLWNGQEALTEYPVEEKIEPIEQVDLGTWGVYDGEKERT